MVSATSSSSTLTQLDRDIAEAERLINDKVQSLLVALRGGADTMQAEARVRDMRRALELLYEQRRKLVRAIFLRRTGIVLAQPEAKAS
jgi:16S rRNA A1518/A1519 N6-dimethyltransferase RsmA/KsgA/DIM1 with predicted DNA glycosylase/AP lyase activity